MRRKIAQPSQWRDPIWRRLQGEENCSTFGRCLRCTRDCAVSLIPSDVICTHTPISGGSRHQEPLGFNSCVCVHVFLWLCGQISVRNHHCGDSLASCHIFKGPFEGSDLVLGQGLELGLGLVVIARAWDLGNHYFTVCSHNYSKANVLVCVLHCVCLCAGESSLRSLLLHIAQLKGSIKDGSYMWKVISFPMYKRKNNPPNRMGFTSWPSFLLTTKLSV